MAGFGPPVLASLPPWGTTRFHLSPESTVRWLFPRFPVRICHICPAHPRCPLPRSINREILQPFTLKERMCPRRMHTSTARKSNSGRSEVQIQVQVQKLQPRRFGTTVLTWPSPRPHARRSLPSRLLPAGRSSPPASRTASEQNHTIEERSRHPRRCSSTAVLLTAKATVCSCAAILRFLVLN